MPQPPSILFAGESWTIATTHIKGVDFFTQYGYGEGARWLKAALESAGMSVSHLPCHRALTEFPATPDELRRYDAVILSDIGSNTLLLHPDTTVSSRATPNRLTALRNYVHGGGALLMIGGYMSFAGIEAKARYHSTPIEELLPVGILPYDDRMEVPEGFCPQAADATHPVLRGLPAEFPPMLFYNRVTAKPGASVLLRRGDDPILAVGDFGRGRAAAFTPDCAPHGATPEFLGWKHFNPFWAQLLNWLMRR